MFSLYIDHNLLIYLSEGKISLSPSNEYVWVYSDEHFCEIERSGNLDLLDDLDKIGARRIKIVLDNKFRITNKAYLEEFENASKKYREFISFKREYSTPKVDFISLLSFFSGNKDAIDLDKIAENFSSDIMNLIGGNLDELVTEDQKNSFINKISFIGQDLQLKLNDISKDLKPVEELRRSLAGSDLSNLNPSHGLIIDQIWGKIKTKYPGISKDQLFGKEPFFKTGIEEELSLFMMAIQCYTALNFIGYWPDIKLSKLSKIYGVSSDASHVGHAAYCHALYSEDKRLCKKAEAIYNYINIPTQIVNIQIEENK